jgi:hypothetical protein
MATAQEADPQHLLIRIRLADGGAVGPNGRLTVDVEAQVNRAAIYPAGRVDLDLLRLRKLENTPGNEYGRLLGQRLCCSLPLQTALVSLARSAYLRVQLMLEPPGYPLSLIRWERVEFTPLGVKGPLALVQQTPFSRFSAVNREETEPTPDVGFHLLVFAASPAGLPTVAAGAEFENLVDAAKSLLDSGWLEVTLAPGLQGLTEGQRAALQHPRIHIAEGAATVETIARVLSESANPFSGLHAIAHGRYLDDGFELMLEDDEGNLRRAATDELVSVWSLPKLRLVYLQSCQSGVSSDEAEKDPRPHVASFMQQLIEAGVPGVIAMQDDIRMADAGRFCRGFYASLLRDGLADTAVNAGRALIRSASDDPDESGSRWSIPAFATRLADAAVWVQSPLRAAQERLKRQIDANWKARYFRDLPIDVLITGKASLDRKTRAGADEFDLISRQPSLLVKARLALAEAVTTEEATPPFTCIIGQRGRAKTQLLERVFLDCVDSCTNSADRNAGRICVMLRLADCAHPAYEPEVTLARAVASYYEENTGLVLDLQSLIARISRDRLVFLVNGDDHVGRGVADGLRLLNQFNEYSGGRHRFLLTLDQNELRVSNLPDNARCFLVQPMRAERVREFLQSEVAGEAERKVLAVLEEYALFDLAEVPWLLNEMLGQARRGTLKQSRADIIGRVVDDGISRYTGSSVTANRVREALQRFAWEVQNRRNYSLPEREAYVILHELRGNRDYPLFGFLNEVIDSCNILASVSEEGIGFNYPGFRSYCAASYIQCQDEQQKRTLLEDITAQLGRQSRAENWRETLYILAGLWDGTAPLLSMILSGSLLHQGEQLYIAARCLQEARLRFNGPCSGEPIVRSIVGSLLQVASPGLRSVATRNKAIQHLGPLREPEALRPLASIVLDQRRSISQSGQETFSYDYSGTRLAAMRALAYSKKAFQTVVEEDPVWSAIPHIEEFSVAWRDCNYCGLADLLGRASDPVSDLAAFSLALGRTKDAFALLTRSFDRPENDSEILWPLTDSLLELADPGMVHFAAARLEREDRHEVLAHMIGRMGLATEGSKEWDFIWKHLESPNRKLSGRCLQSLGELLCAEALPVCRAWLTSKPANNPYFALQALSRLGDWQDLELIEQLQWDAVRNDPNKRLFLDSVRTEVYDAIYWRLAGGLSREVMAPFPPAAAGQQTTQPAKSMKAGS